MNRIIKDATVLRFHNEDHAPIQDHIESFAAAFDVSGRLKLLKGAHIL